MKCTACPIHLEGCKSNCIGGRGVHNGIMFVGEAPGAEEDMSGRPFVGKAGQFLQALIDDVGLGGLAYFTNVIRCRPEGNRQPKIDEIRKCTSEHFYDELNEVNPKLIVVCGKTPAKFFTDDNNVSINKMRGSLIDWRGYKVFFTFHPSSVNYDRRNVAYLQADFQEIKRIWLNGVKAVRHNTGYTIKPWSELKREKRTEVIAVDIETIGFDPYAPGARIMSIAASPEGDAAYYGFLDTFPGSGALRACLEALRPFQRWVCHSTPFDMGWLTRGLPADHWVWGKHWGDTLIDLQFYDEHYPDRSLAHLSKVFTKTEKFNTPEFVTGGFPKGWDKPENRKTLKRYNCRDAICTIRLHEYLKPKCEQLRVYGAWDWVNGNLKVVVRMRHDGIHIDQDALSDLSSMSMRKKLRLQMKIVPTGVLVLDKKKGYKTDIKVLSHHLFHKLRLPVLSRTEKTKQPSVDKPTLEKLALIDRTGFVKRLLKLRKWAKIADTYCPNLRKWGEIAHPRVFLSKSDSSEGEYGTDTGRVTVETFINLPSKDKSVKKCVTSRYGKEGIIVCMDLSQIEMRILADLSKDERLMQAFEEGRDLHKFTASQIFGIKEEDVDAEQRQKAKTVNFGVVYGQTAYGLSQTSGMPQSEAGHFIGRYFKRFKGIADYIESQVRRAISDKIVYSPIGRPFHLPNAIHPKDKDCRKAVNSPIQSAAGDYDVECIAQVQQAIQGESFQAGVELAVYDSVIMDWLLEDFKKTDKDFWDKVFIVDPCESMRTLGWDIEVPIKYDLTSGPSWGECQ